MRGHGWEIKSISQMGEYQDGASEWFKPRMSVMNTNMTIVVILDFVLTFLPVVSNSER